jgi:zinc transporter 5/7
MVMRHIFSHEESRYLFYFLVVNMCFMGVELTVGLWSNSLGLISDAGHMFFDNGALCIGLCASFISRWGADADYSYGYGRFEVRPARSLFA